MNPPADGATSAHRTRTNRMDTAMHQDATSASLAADHDVIDPPAPPRPATSHVRLQGLAR